MPDVITKDPNADLDYGVDWTDWLDAREDTIDTSTWIIPAELDQHDPTHDDKTSTVWLTGGTAGAEHVVTNRIVTVGGRTDDRSLTIQVRDR